AAARHPFGASRDRAMRAPGPQHATEPGMVEHPGLEPGRGPPEAPGRQDQEDRRRHDRQDGSDHAQRPEDEAERDVARTPTNMKDGAMWGSVSLIRHDERASGQSTLPARNRPPCASSGNAPLRRLRRGLVQIERPAAYDKRLHDRTLY